MAQAFLIEKQTGKVIQAFTEDIEIKPWPTDTEEETNPFVEQEGDPLRFVQEFTFKLSKEQQKIFYRIVRKFSKIPRKLKKAAGHIIQTRIGEFSISEADGNVIDRSPLIHYAIEKGYPHTKWARKSLQLIKWSVINYEKTLHK